MHTNNKASFWKLFFYLFLYAALLFSLFMINSNNAIKEQERVRATEASFNYKFMVSLSHSLGGGSKEALRILNVADYKEFYNLFKEAETDYEIMKASQNTKSAQQSNLTFNLAIILITGYLLIKAIGLQMKVAIHLR